MRPTRTSFPNALMLAGLALSGASLWMLHADAWDLGGRSPVLNFDTAQVAVAARELAQTGKLGTTFALPVELARHPRPPWPLTMVPPGLIGIEALILRLAPDPVDASGMHHGSWARPDQREWLLLSFPFMCFVMIGVTLGLAIRHALRKWCPDMPETARAGAGLVVGLVFLLDPEAQHLAVGPFSELPLTFGVVGAITAIALARQSERPFLFGLLLGLASSFGTLVPWLAPLLLAAATVAAPAPRRGRTLALASLGCVLPLVPWWYYQWSALGAPGRDLSHLAVWDGVGGLTWFSIYHLPRMPDLPNGMEAFTLLSHKIARRLPGLTLAMLAGPRALWVALLVSWLALARPTRSQAVAGVAVLAVATGGLITAALGIPWIRSAFPGRIVLEAAGLLAGWGLVARSAQSGFTPATRRALVAFLVVLALGWGGLQTVQGVREASQVVQQRGTPSVILLLKLAVLMNREIPGDEAVMSNLGPELAWQARRPVIHLALRPEDMAACRRRLDFRHVILCFRDSSRAWPGWSELFAHPATMAKDPTLNIERTRHYQSSDGFQVVWLELGPLEPALAVARRRAR